MTADTIEVAWSLREGEWFARGYGMPWRKVSGVHLAERESDAMLLHAVTPMFPLARGRIPQLRRLEPTYRLPKEQGHDTR